MASLSNRARIQATALLKQEAEYRVAAQLLHVVAIAQRYAIHRQQPLAAIPIPQLEMTTAQRHEGVKEGAPLIATDAALGF